MKDFVVAIRDGGRGTVGRRPAARPGPPRAAAASHKAIAGLGAT